jgi:Uma2 family endonuclease
MVTTQRMTVEEYFALPEEKPYVEYVNGEVCPKPMPDWMHAAIVTRLIEVLLRHASEFGGHPLVEGRTGFDDPRDVRFLLPDVQFHAAGRPWKQRPMPPPTLAVEVRSPEQSMASLREKCRFYRAHGVDVCWLIDPEARIAEVFDAAREGVLLPADAALESEALPGFRFRLADLFATLDAD